MKTIIIFGASSDIGISLAEYFYNHNYQVVATYNINKVSKDNIDYLHCDITNEEDIIKVFEYTKEKYQKIDIIVNMSAISLDNNFENKTKYEFMKVLEVNLVGAFLTSKVYANYEKNGVIINISSTDGIDTFSEYNIDYAASKAGLITMSKNLSLCTTNKVICICPNWIDSKTTNDMDKEYLASELKRIKQTRLITIQELNDCIYKILNTNNKSGTLYRIDTKENKLWMEEI